MVNGISNVKSNNTHAMVAELKRAHAAKEDVVVSFLPTQFLEQLLSEQRRMSSGGMPSGGAEPQPSDSESQLPEGTAWPWSSVGQTEQRTDGPGWFRGRRLVIQER